jgi:mannitol-specific phosphotransferase system IIBC component
MPGVPRHLIEHSLNISKTARPIKQKLRWFARDKKEAIRAEVTQLLTAGFIKEVYHPDWLANPVLVRKIMNGECALIILILTNTALKTPSAYLA